MSGSKRLSLRAGQFLARNTSDASTFPLDAIRLDAYCELNGIPLRFRPYRWKPTRSHDETPFDHVEKMPASPSIQWAVDVFETEPGGVHDSSREDQLIGWLYEKMIRDGWTGKDAPEQLEYILRRSQNSEHRKWLDKKRNTRAWVEEGFRLRQEKMERQRVREIIRRGQRWINDSIRQDTSIEAKEIDISQPGYLPVRPKRSVAADVMNTASNAHPKRLRR